MSKNKAKTQRLIPLQVKPKAELREKLERIAQENSLSLNDVANLALAAGIGMVESKLGDLQDKAA